MRSTSKPILFSGAMVRAILNGSKTQTRRVVKPDNVHSCGWMSGPWTTADGALAPSEDGSWKFGKDGVGRRDPNNFYVDYQVQCPYGQRGDTLYVKETFRVWSCFDSLVEGPIADADAERREWLQKRVQYRADVEQEDDALKRPWRPSIFMPPWLSRLALAVESVRIERLQDISEEDAIAEGVIESEAGRAAERALQIYKGQKCPASVLQYADLWNSINGPGAWEANPWVWVINFNVQSRSS